MTQKGPGSMGGLYANTANLRRSLRHVSGKSVFCETIFAKIISTDSIVGRPKLKTISKWSDIF
tara:strand:+ start:14 stop:202 length:189 start_codon:yes stop_codon:yes gene_type:complete